MKIFFSVLYLLILNLFTLSNIKAQCSQDYNWTNWKSFSGKSAIGIINNGGQKVRVTMTANYTFSSTPVIYTYQKFSGFNSPIPNSTVPKTTWAAGAGGSTKMCFNQIVMNPVLLISSLGRPSMDVSLHFSIPYLVLYDGGGMTYPDDSTIIGNEGYAILLFPGDFNCVTIYSTTPEYYTNITWGLNPPKFAVDITGSPISCDSVTLTAKGGSSYLWNGGASPNSSTNTFYQSGTYFLTVTDKNGCTVKTSKTVTVKQKKYSTINKIIYEGQNYLGYTSTGTYIDTLMASNGCDSIRTLNLTIKPKFVTTINHTVCHGQSYLGYTSTGTYIDTLKASNGYDSVRILNLTVRPMPFVKINRSICKGQSYLGYTSTGVYVDTFVSVNGCDSIRQLNLQVIPPSKTTQHISICQGQQFLGHTVTGKYSDTLVSTTGCDSIITIFLTVEKNCEVYFPTAFTPNNDGKNDVFRILNPHNLKDYSLKIYDRWGQLIFETKDVTSGWDGKYKGNLQPVGAYVWYCKFYQKGSIQEMEGAVTLIR